MSTPAPIGFLVLAAGHGRRFGGCKLSASFAAEQTVLGQVLDSIKPLQAPVCVVTSHSKKTVLQLALDKRVNVIEMPQDSVGLGASIAYGVGATQHWGGWILCLGDMPWISPSIYRQVWELACEGDAGQVAPMISRRRGHPVFFNKHYGKRLCLLTGDTGAASVIDPLVLTTFPVVDAALFKDVDRPEDLMGEGSNYGAAAGAKNLT